MPPSKPDLGAGELEVLRILWELGASTVREVLGQLEARRRNLAYNTVQTVLTRLVDKGFAARDDRGASHVFKARVTRDQFGQRRVRELLDGVYRGSAGSLVVQLVRSGRLDADEIEELQRMLDELARGKSQGKGKR